MALSASAPMRCRVSGSEGCVDRDEIGFPEERGQVGARGVEAALGRGIGGRGILVEHAHAEAEGPPRHARPMRPKPMIPRVLPCTSPPSRTHVLPLLEPALAHVLVALDHAPGRGHEERPREVCRGLGEDVRGIGDDDAPPGGRLHVDIVEADGDVGDHAQVRAAGQDLLIDRVGDEADSPWHPLSRAINSGFGSGASPSWMSTRARLRASRTASVGQRTRDQNGGARGGVGHECPSS